MKSENRQDKIADAIRESLVSPNVADSNLEAANVVDVVDKLAWSIRQAFGTTAESMTEDYNCDPEKLMGVTFGLHRIAMSIEGLAEAIDRLSGHQYKARK